MDLIFPTFALTMAFGGIAYSAAIAFASTLNLVAIMEE